MRRSHLDLRPLKLNISTPSGCSGLEMTLRTDMKQAMMTRKLADFLPFVSLIILMDIPSMGSRHHPSFFFPISPTMVLYVVGGLANAPGPVPGQFLVDCTFETAAEVHLRNAA